MRILLAALLLAFASPQESLEKKVADLVQKLSDDSIDARDQAVRDLAALGTGAIPLLEKSLARLDGEMRGRVNEAIQAIRSRDTLSKTLPPLRTITLEHLNRPAREALEEISRQAGIPCQFEGDLGKEAVSVKLKDATPLQAIDAVCRAHGQIQAQGQVPEALAFPGAGHRGSTPTTMLFTAGPTPPYPTAYARHYRARVTSVSLTKLNNFQANESTGNLQLELQWQVNVSPRSCIKFEITELKDDQGRSLLPEEKDAELNARGRTVFGNAGWESGTQETFDFKYPEAGATRIAILRGAFVLCYPKEEKTLVFEKPAEAKGKSLELHGMKVTLEDYQVRGNEHVLKLSATGKYTGPADPAKRDGDPDGFDSRMPFTYEDVQPVTESGEPLNTTGMSGGSEENGYSMTITYTSEKPQRLKEIRLPCVLVHHLDEVKFELKDIAFPK